MGSGICVFWKLTIPYFTIIKRIRVGTFNVNGTIPTQDLSSWIRNADTQGSASSLLKQTVSPVSSALSGSVLSGLGESKLTLLL